MARPSWDNPALLGDLRNRQVGVESPLQLLERLQRKAEALQASMPGLSRAQALAAAFDREVDKYHND